MSHFLLPFLPSGPLEMTQCWPLLSVSILGRWGVVPLVPGDHSRPCRLPPGFTYCSRSPRAPCVNSPGPSFVLGSDLLLLHCVLCRVTSPYTSSLFFCVCVCGCGMLLLMKRHFKTHHFCTSNTLFSRFYFHFAFY